MTNTRAIEIIRDGMEIKRHPKDLTLTVAEVEEAKQMAISALENIGHLKDRPCTVCEFKKENGCCKWTCVFEEV